MCIYTEKLLLLGPNIAGKACSSPPGWPLGKAFSKKWPLSNDGWSVNRSFLGKKEGGEEVLSYIIMFTPSSSCGKDLGPISISLPRENEVRRHLNNFSKFPQPAVGKARISAHLNPKSQALVPGLCCLPHNRHSVDYWGNKMFQNHLCCALYPVSVVFCLIFSHGYSSWTLCAWCKGIVLMCAKLRKYSVSVFCCF